MRSRAFASFAWGVLGFTVLIILWGAFVRATGSGAGCGSHWPTCNGTVIPRSPQLETIIEFTHRVTGGLGGLLIIGLLVWAFRLYPKGHAIRFAAFWSFIFFVIEGLIGAGLVRFELVADNASIGRAFSIAIHLVNTLVLLFFMTLTAWWASGGQPFRHIPATRETWMLAGGLAAMILLSATGAVTALGDTLFPSDSLAQGLQDDFSVGVNFLKRLRIIHPFLALLTSFYIAYIGTSFRSGSQSLTVRRLATGLIALFGLQLAAGLLNVVLLVPVWMQIVHLFIADTIWITLVLLTATVLAAQAEQTETKPEREVVATS